MDKLVDLIREVPRYSVWRFEMICDWMAPFWNRGTLSYRIDSDGEPRGFCIIKLFRNLEQFLEPFVHEPCGKFCMIEALVAKEPVTMAALCDELIERWGRQQIILWDRGERTESGAPRMFRWGQFQKLARRITYGGVKCA